MIWGIAITLSLAPLFGWHDPNFEQVVNEEKICMVSQDLGYQIFATMSTFYIPLVIILLLYWKIFMTARTRLRKRLAAKAKPVDFSSNGAGKIESQIAILGRKSELHLFSSLDHTFLVHLLF